MMCVGLGPISFKSIASSGRDPPPTIPIRAQLPEPRVPTLLSRALTVSCPLTTSAGYEPRGNDCGRTFIWRRFNQVYNLTVCVLLAISRRPEMS